MPPVTVIPFTLLKALFRNRIGAGLKAVVLQLNIPIRWIYSAATILHLKSDRTHSLSGDINGNDEIADPVLTGNEENAYRVVTVQNTVH